METGGPGRGRREILKRGALGAASVAAVAVAAGAATQPRAVAAPSGTTRTMRLVGRDWHTDSAKLPGKGDQYKVYGALHDPAGGKVGEFFSTNIGVDSPFQITGEGLGTFELHTLALPGGTVVGVGIGGGPERSYAIVGGTGRYAGARGSYVARQDTYGLGGSGKAELLLTFLE